MIKRWIISLALVSLNTWAGNSPHVEFETTLGNFTIELNQEKAPISVENFIRYVEDGSYEGSIFHRIIPGFMAQGGGYNAEMKRLNTYSPIKNEANNGLENKVATVAMARTQNPDSATRQFFINLVDNDFLNYGERPPGYAVFGKVTSGFEIIKLMAKQETGSLGYMNDVPVEPIVITNVTFIPAVKPDEPTDREDSLKESPIADQTSTDKALSDVAAMLAEETIDSTTSLNSHMSASGHTTETTSSLTENDTNKKVFSVKNTESNIAPDIDIIKNIDDINNLAPTSTDIPTVKTSLDHMSAEQAIQSIMKETLEKNKHVLETMTNKP